MIHSLQPCDCYWPLCAVPHREAISIIFVCLCYDKYHVDFEVELWTPHCKFTLQLLCKTKNIILSS